MLASTVDTIRLSLHVLAATIWVGGQVTLAALVPALRGMGAEVPRAAARAYNRIAWPAFGVLILTGIWNVTAVSDDVHGNYAVVLDIKMAVVVLSGVAAWLHARAKSKRGLAVFGALSGLSALTALCLGVLLAG
jgi:putative copper export protein